MKIATTQPDHIFEVEGVNSKIQLETLERTWQHHLAQRLLEQGCNAHGYGSVLISWRVICGQDVTIDVDCIFEGRVVLGDGVKVGAYSVMRIARFLLA